MKPYGDIGSYIADSRYKADRHGEGYDVGGSDAGLTDTAGADGGDGGSE